MAQENKIKLEIELTKNEDHSFSVAITSKQRKLVTMGSGNNYQEAFGQALDLQFAPIAIFCRKCGHESESMVDAICDDCS